MMWENNSESSIQNFLQIKTSIKVIENGIPNVSTGAQRVMEGQVKLQ